MKLIYLAMTLMTLMTCTTAVVFSMENLESAPFFRATKKQPYHLSVGAVLFNKDGKIACHHFPEIFGYKEIYILMRESMENDETPIMALHRGLAEEFGATGKPIAFLGCLSGHLPDAQLSFEKTTLYIACQLIDWHPEDRDLKDPEAGSSIEWLESNALISIMQQQGIRFQHRVDADESEMIKRALPYIAQTLENAKIVLNTNATEACRP